jgi:hypothetical protein
MQLPWPLTPDTILEFQFYDVSSKPGETKLVATGTLLLMENGVILSNGEHRVHVVSEQTDSRNHNVVIDFDARSSVHSDDPIVEELLHGEFKRAETVTYEAVVRKLPPVLDVLMAGISQAKWDAFVALLSVIDVFACDKQDARYTEDVAKAFGETGIIPVDHLLFYSRFCALRTERRGHSFLDNFISFWVNFGRTRTILATRPDLRSVPFLLDVLIKCIADEPDRIYTADCGHILEHLQVALRQLQDAVGRRINLHLAFFYRDLAGFPDKVIFLEIVRIHLAKLDVVGSAFCRDCFLDLLSVCVTPQTFILFCTPQSVAATSGFSRSILNRFGELLDNYQCVHSVTALLLVVMRHFAPPELEVLFPSLTPFIALYAKTEQSPNPNDAIFPFIFALVLLNKQDLATPGSIQVLRMILQGSAAAINGAPEDLNLVVRVGPEGAKRNLLVFGDSDGIILKTSDVWPRIAWVAQHLCIRAIATVSSIATLNEVIVPCFGVGFASSLFGRLRDATSRFLDAQARILLSSPGVRTYKFVKNLLRNVTADNISFFTQLWRLEKTLFGSGARCTAFVMRALRHCSIEGKLAVFQGTPLEDLVTKFDGMNRALSALDRSDDNFHDVVADRLLELAEFMRPSPDARIRVILELGQFHAQHKYENEGTIAQLTAAALTAEVLVCRHKIPPGSFVNESHPCRDFVDACPSAATEEIRDDPILSVTPSIAGYCDSKYFCECGLIHLIQTAMDSCKRASLFELSTRIHSLLRPIAEIRHLWKVLDKHFQNGSMAWQILATFAANKERMLGVYYLVQFQGEGSYIYRDAQWANLWTFSEAIKRRAKVMAGGKKVKVENEGERLAEPDKLDKSFYYAHVKAVQPYFTPPERKSRLTVFEQNHNVSRFYYDLPQYKGGHEIEHLWLKRVMIRLTNPLPYIASRVKIDHQAIETAQFRPIEYSCQSLQQQVDKIKEAATLKDFTALQPLLQGSLITQVNEGPKKMAEVFLTGANEDEHTMMLRKLFRKFLNANSIGVQAHQEYVKTVPVFQPMQEQLEAGLNRLRSTIQPYLK